MKARRSFVLLCKLALALLALTVLVDGEPPPPTRPRAAIAPVGTGSVPRVAQVPVAPLSEVEHEHEHEHEVSAAPTTAPSTAPAPAPAAPRDGLRGLIALLRRGEAQLVQPAWLVAPDGTRVPVYTQDEREVLDAEAETVADRRGTVVGLLEDVRADAVVGFAYDWDDPALAVEVDLFVDGFHALTVPAGARRADGGPGGFRAGALPALADGAAHVVQALARRAGEARSAELLGSPWRVGGNRVATAAVESWAREAVVGSAGDEDGGAPTLHVRFDGAPLPPVVVAGGTFRVALPAHDPARAHDVQVLVEDAQVPGLLREARGSPVRLEADGDAEEPENQLPRGAVAFVTPAQITGWALDPDLGDAPIQVDVHVDGRFVARLRADQEFAALAHQGISPFHLWIFDVPPDLQDGREHVLSAFAVNEPAGANPELAGSPVPFRSVSNTAPSGWVDQADPERLAGWAYDADRGAGPIEVEVWVDGALWRVLLADQARPDLVPVVCPEPAHGWSVAAPEVLRDGGFHTLRVLARNHPPGPAQELAGSPRELGAVRPWLGVSIEGAPPRGARLVHVAEGSPAAQAGLLAGDLALTLNGEPAPMDPEPFARWIQARLPGEVVAVTYERHEAAGPVTRTTHVTLGTRPE